MHSGCEEPSSFTHLARPRLVAPSRAASADQELERLRQALAEARGEIASLREQLRMRDAHLALLEQTDPAARTAPGAAAPSAPEPSPAASLSRIEVLAPEPEAASPAERRSTERWSCALDLEFAEESHFYAGLSQDISTGGLFLATYRELAVGTALRLRFELPGGAPIEAAGEVRWVRQPGPEGRPGVGVAFTELSPEALERIRAFCETVPPIYVEL